jgi:hypothetical protein
MHAKPLRSTFGTICLLFDRRTLLCRPDRELLEVIEKVHHKAHSILREVERKIVVVRWIGDLFPTPFLRIEEEVRAIINQTGWEYAQLHQKSASAGRYTTCLERRETYRRTDQALVRLADLDVDQIQAIRHYEH